MDRLGFLATLLRFCMRSAAIVLILAESARAASPDDPGRGRREQDDLRRYARDTWRSFDRMALRGGLPADGLKREGDGTWRPTGSTTPMDVGAYLWSTLAAERLGIIDAAEARNRLDRTLAAIGRLKRVHGLFLDKLDPRTGAPLETSPDGHQPIHPKLSAVDNGWLATGLVMVRNTRPELSERALVLCHSLVLG
jgi:hypothetical protein